MSSFPQWVENRSLFHRFNYKIFEWDYYLIRSDSAGWLFQNNYYTITSKIGKLFLYLIHICIFALDKTNYQMFFLIHLIAKIKLGILNLFKLGSNHTLPFQNMLFNQIFYWFFMKKICSKKGPGERWYAKTFFKFFSSLRINFDLAKYLFPISHST